MKRLTFVSFAASLLMAASCAESEMPEFTSGNQPELHFSTEGGSQTVSVSGKNISSWTAHATGSWIKLTPDEAAGTILVAVDRTEDIDRKTGEVIVYTDADRVMKIPVTQDGNGIIYDRSSAKLMGFRGKVRTASFWFDPIHMWEQQPGFLRNLEFNKQGMLTYFEFTYKRAFIVDFAIEVTYDEQNRVSTIHGVSSDMSEENFPNDYTIEFVYGDHGKYVCLENAFGPVETWGFLTFSRAWLPSSIKNLKEIRLKSDYMRRFQPSEDGKGIDHCELIFGETPVDPKGEDDPAWAYELAYKAYFPIKEEGKPEDEGKPNPEGTYYFLNKYEFEGNYTGRMTYDTQFVGITIPVISTFDIDHRNGLIYSQEIRNDEVYVGRPLLLKRYYPDFRNSCFYFEDDLGTYYRMDIKYNDVYDVTELNNASTDAYAKFSYTYDSNGNWTSLDMETNKMPDNKIDEKREVKYYR